MKHYPLFVLLSLAMPLVHGEMTVSLEASEPGQVPLGTKVYFQAAVQGGEGERLWYRYRVRRDAEEYRTVRDFGPDSLLEWRAYDLEGTYEIEVAVRNLASGEIATAVSTTTVLSRTVDSEPVVSGTDHPLVFLYSAPPCPEGQRMRAVFNAPDGLMTFTPYKACDGAHTMNFSLAGLRAETVYAVRHQIDTGSELASGPIQSLKTGGVDIELAANSVTVPPFGRHQYPVLVFSSLGQVPTATDLEGKLIWYSPHGFSGFTRMENGGSFLGVNQDPTREQSYQTFTEFDLYGTTLRETNAARVNEQLAEMGKNPITSFHHEASRLPNGNMLVLAASERIIPNPKGEGEVDYIGDTILVLDAKSLAVVWVWDSFDYLDVRETGPADHPCRPIGAGCPPFYLKPTAVDWLHSNSLQRTPDGNIVISVRHLDLVIKIAFEDGEGDGRVLWRLGKTGDFHIDSSDPWPWFSHQHDANMLSDGKTVLVYDNGNARVAANESGNSRGQAFEIDEVNRVVKPVLNADLGATCFALGTAQRLPNGNYHFNNGWIFGGGGVGYSQAVETDAEGQIVYTLRTEGPMYRVFRARDLYTRPY